MTERTQRTLEQAIGLANRIGLTGTEKKLRHVLETGDKQTLDYCADVMRSCIALSKGLGRPERIAQYKELSKLITKARRLLNR